jgi:hypothetical protein
MTQVAVVSREENGVFGQQLLDQRVVLHGVNLWIPARDRPGCRQICGQGETLALTLWMSSDRDKRGAQWPAEVRHADL